MEGSSAKEVTQGSTSIYYSYGGPCYFLQEALRAILRCLGLESICTHEKSPGSDATRHESSSSTQESSSSTDPSSTSQLPGVITFEDAPSISASSLAVPPRPPISTGSGPQTN